MIDSLLLFGLLFFSLMGWGLLAFSKLKIHVAIIPIFIFSSITVALFSAGLLNIMPLMVSIIYFGGLILGIIYIYKMIRGKQQFKISELLTPSTFFFGLFIAFLMFQLKGVYYTHYDNFSHWALIVKEIYMLNGLPDSSTVISFQNYPPGTAIFIYYILKIVGYAESYSLMAQGFVIAASLTVLFVFSSWKKPAYIVLTLIVAFALVTVDVDSLYNLIVDITLGMVAFAIVIIAYFYRNDWKKSILVNTPVLLFLILIKDSGKLLLTMSVIPILFFIYNNELKGKLFKIANINLVSKVITLLIIVPTFMSYLWLMYTEKAYHSAYGNNKFAVTPGKVTSVTKSEEFINTLFSKMVDSFVNIDLNIFQIYLALNIAFVIGIVIFYIANKKHSRLSLYTFIYTNGALFLYLGSLYVMYMFLMPENEATRLASYNRYLSTIIIFIGAIGMSALLIEWSKLKNGVTKAALAIIFAGLFLFPATQNIDKFSEKPDISESIRLEVKPLVQKVLKQGEPDPSILYYSPESKDDRGYLQFIVLYEQLSRNYKIASSCETSEEKETFLETLGQSQYLILVENDRSSCISSIISDEDSRGVYRINKVEDEIVLELVE